MLVTDPTCSHKPSVMHQTQWWNIYEIQKQNLFACFIVKEGTKRKIYDSTIIPKTLGVGLVSVLTRQKMQVFIFALKLMVQIF